METKQWKERTLHIGCFHGHLPVVQYLIEKGANIETKDAAEQTLLHKACTDGYLPVVQYLIEKGANIETKDKD